MVAIDTSVIIAPDQAFYQPGKAVTLEAHAAIGHRVVATISHLAEHVATVTAEVTDGTALLTWTPPPTAPAGYGVDATVYDADGAPLATATTAFDVLDQWTQAPRYGFLSEFTPGRDNAEETMAQLMRYHVNGLQFYDWQYRHETLLPPGEPYEDVLGRRLSLVAVERLIDAAHRRNIAAMPYTAIYGASPAFYQAHPDWAMYEASDRPYVFGGGMLMIMDPTPGSAWAEHLQHEYRSVLEQTTFDGIHIDQYGSPMRGYNASGEPVQLDSAFPAFINQTVEMVDEMRGDTGAVIFNLVRNWPVRTVAPSRQDAVYIEVWDPYNHFLDLSRLIIEAQALSGDKPVILAAYIHPDHVENSRLANALIFASGGYQLELGEPNGALADPYFPLYGQMSEALQDVKRRYYDFLVRYENVLSVGTTDATRTRSSALSIDGVETGSRRSRGRVAVVVRASADRETFSLVNLMGIDGDKWNVPLTHGQTPLLDLAVTLQTERPVSRIWIASPDTDSPHAVPVEFTSTTGAVSFSLPSLAYWNMIVVEYES